VGCAASQRSRDTRRSAAAIGFAAMKASMSCFRILAIFVRAITAALRSAVITTRKSTKEIGKPVKNAARILSRKCMFGTARMNIILKNCPILPPLSRLTAPNAEKELFYLTADTHHFVECIVAITVQSPTKNGKKLFGNTKRRLNNLKYAKNTITTKDLLHNNSPSD